MSVIKTQEAISQAWTIYKREWTLVLPILILVGLLSLPFERIIGQQAVAFSVSLQIVQFILSALVTLALRRTTVRLVDGERVEWGNLLEGVTVSQVFYYIVAGFLVGVASFLSFLFFVIPGIIIATALSQYEYFIATGESVGISDPLMKSREITRGNRIDLFIASVGIAFLTLLSLVTIIGIFVAPAVAALAYAVIYRQLNPKAGMEPAAIAA